MSNVRGPTPFAIFDSLTRPSKQFFSSVESRFALGWRRKALSHFAHILVAKDRQYDKLTALHCGRYCHVKVHVTALELIKGMRCDGT